MKRHFQVIATLLVITLAVFLGVSTFYRTIRTRMARFSAGLPAVERTETAGNPAATLFSDIGISREEDTAAGPRPSIRARPETSRDGRTGIRRRLALRGTACGGAGTAVAVIEDRKTGRQGLYRTGDPIIGGRIRIILEDRAVLRFNGRDITLKIEAPHRTGPTAPTGPPEAICVYREDIERALGNAKAVMNQVDIRPVAAGKGGGVKILSIAPGSIFEKLGLKAGDIVREINGIPIRHPEHVAALYKKLSNSLPAVTLERLDPALGSALLGLDRNMAGVAQEVSRVLRRIESGGDIPILLTRGGNPEKLTYRVK